MSYCFCIKTDGTRCTRPVSKAPGKNHLFCWQHQDCPNPFSLSPVAHDY